MDCRFDVKRLICRFKGVSKSVKFLELFIFILRFLCGANTIDVLTQFNRLALHYKKFVLDNKDFTNLKRIFYFDFCDT